MLIQEHYDNKLLLHTPAKINLFLEVLNKRPDGYHSINTFMQAVSLCDFIEYEIIPDIEARLTISSEQELPSGADNLICRAYDLMKRAFSLSRGLSIRLKKNIPIAAGLGGGSSDGAATILACNILFSLNLTYPQMAELGLKLGSDVPFFFTSGQALATGRGEQLVETSYPTEYRIVLVSPRRGVSTADSYAALRRSLTTKKRPFSLQECGTVDELFACLKNADNDFERVQMKSHPGLKELRDALVEQGAMLVRMSGSGPTLFGAFSTENESTLKEIEERGDWRVFTVQPITLPMQITK